MQLPTDYEAGRFLLRVPLANGRTARLLVDTCGGFVIGRAVAAGLPTVPTGDADHPDRLDLPLDPPVTTGRAFALLTDTVTSGDGVLPAGWFAGRIWAFDHRRHTVSLLPAAPVGRSTPLGLAGPDRDSPGAFPSVEVVVDGQHLRLLVDTGATADLTPAARQTVDAADPRTGDGPSRRASSFLAVSVVEGWRRRHPDWPVVERPTPYAELMIRADGVHLGGVDLGTVWFESRPDDTFRGRMSALVGHPVEGALGGAPFQDRHRLVLDYPGSRLFLD